MAPETGGTGKAMDRERRREDPPARAQLRAELNEDQRLALSELERFGWELKFTATRCSRTACRCARAASA